MKRYLLNFISIACLLLLFNSCKKENNNTVSVIYEQTYCADSWGSYNVEDGTLLNNLTIFLENNDINIQELKIEQYKDAQDCKACNCLSGKKYIGVIKSVDLEKIKQYGFKEA